MQSTSLMVRLPLSGTVACLFTGDGDRQPGFEAPRVSGQVLVAEEEGSSVPVALQEQGGQVPRAVVWHRGGVQAEAPFAEGPHGGGILEQRKAGVDLIYINSAFLIDAIRSATHVFK